MPPSTHTRFRYYEEDPTVQDIVTEDPFLTAKTPYVPKYESEAPKMEGHKVTLPASPLSAPSCPVMYPTLDQFKDPVAYIQGLAEIGTRYGIVKVVIPEELRDNATPNYSSDIRVPTRRQVVNRLRLSKMYQDGSDFFLGDMESNNAANVSSFYSNLSRKEPSLEELGYDEYYRTLESDYWSLVVGGGAVLSDGGVRNSSNSSSSSSSSESESESEDDRSGEKVKARPPVLKVQYGSDLPYGEFHDILKMKPGATKTLLRSISTDSLLGMLGQDFMGLSEPFLYVGATFSTFAWHNEDSYLPSCSYNHSGAPKVWYGVPGGCQFDLVNIVKGAIPNADIHGIVTMLEPRYLIERGVPVYSAIHQPGELMVTFPGAFHAGFNAGFGISEASNFATPTWLPIARLAVQKYASSRIRTTPFSPLRLVVATAINILTQLKDVNKLPFPELGLLDSPIHQCADGCIQRYPDLGILIPDELRRAAEHLRSAISLSVAHGVDSFGSLYYLPVVQYLAREERKKVETEGEKLFATEVEEMMSGVGVVPPTGSLPIYLSPLDLGLPSPKNSSSEDLETPILKIPQEMCLVEGLLAAVGQHVPPKVVADSEMTHLLPAFEDPYPDLHLKTIPLATRMGGSSKETSTTASGGSPSPKRVPQPSQTVANPPGSPLRAGGRMMGGRMMGGRMMGGALPMSPSDKYKSRKIPVVTKGMDSWEVLEEMGSRFGTQPISTPECRICQRLCWLVGLRCECPSQNETMVCVSHLGDQKSPSHSALPCGCLSSQVSLWVRCSPDVLCQLADNVEFCCSPEAELLDLEPSVPNTPGPTSTPPPIV